jgi:hypothetical protein
MHSPRGSSPRRYHVETKGQRVLVGLTREETFEFERLEIAWVFEEGAPTTSRERRWLELYRKHEEAWKVWMAQA